MEKELLYVGTYKDTDGNKILKIGTTNDLNRRRYEHNHNYRRAKTHTMPKEESFRYIWTLPLSKYNTLRYEDKNRKMWQKALRVLPARCQTGKPRRKPTGQNRAGAHPRQHSSPFIFCKQKNGRRGFAVSVCIMHCAARRSISRPCPGRHPSLWFCPYPAF